MTSQHPLFAPTSFDTSQRIKLLKWYAFTQYDVKNKRMFLKRAECPQVTLKDLYIGSVLTIYSRQIKLADYGDVYTKKKFESANEKYIFMKNICYDQT